MTNRRFGLDRRASRHWREEIRNVGSVVVLSTADYDAPLWTNKQHIGSRLASEVPVLYVESLGLRRPRLNYTDLRRIGRRILRLAHRGPDPVVTQSRPHPELLQIMSPVVVPVHGSELIRVVNRKLMRLQSRKLIRELPRPRVLWAYTPLAVDIVDLDDFDVVIYHCVDDLGSIPGVSAKLIDALERRFAPLADIVVTTSPALRERLGELNPNTHYLHNVVDAKHFARASQPGLIPDDIAEIPEPRALFVGALSDHKLDWELLTGVMASLPDWSFVFVGPVGEETEQRGLSSVSHMSNIHVIGHRRYEELPDYMRGARVGLIPYRITEHTSSIFPMKVLEYRAAALPVLSTPLPALSGYADEGITLRSDANGFTEELVAIADPNRENGLNLSSYVPTWDDLLDVIMSLIVSSLPS